MSDNGDRARRERHESRLEQLDRNWTDLLQELRVTQTGVQLLTGFLLTLPFQSKFADLTVFERTVYLTTVAAAVLATALVITPVSLHRMLFRRHAPRETVQIGHRLALAGLTLLGVAMLDVVTLVFAVVLGDRVGVIAGAVVGIIILVLWAALPLRRGSWRIRTEQPVPLEGRLPAA